jgi:hypothetical protein
MTDPKKLYDSKRIVRLLTFIFHNHFAEMAEIAPDKRLFVTPGQFFDWLDSNRYLFDAEELVEGFNKINPDGKVDHDDLEYAIELAGSGQAPAAIGPLWYEILLGDRPPLKHEVETINMFMLVSWKDGTVSPLQTVLTRKMVEDQGGAMSDGTAAALAVGFMVGTYINEIASNGLDSLHDAGYDLSPPAGTPDPYHVMCGAVVNVLGQLSQPELARRVRECLVLSQRLLRPPTEAWQVAGQPPAAVPPKGNGPESGGTGGWAT